MSATISTYLARKGPKGCQVSGFGGLYICRNGSCTPLSKYLPMNASFLRSILVTAVTVAIIGTAGQAFGGLIVLDLKVATASSMSVSDPDENGGIPTENGTVLHSVDFQPASASTTSSTGSTTSIGHGQATMVSFTHLVASALVTRLTREAKSTVSNPAPTSLLRPPQFMHG